MLELISDKIWPDRLMELASIAQVPTWKSMASCFLVLRDQFLTPAGPGRSTISHNTCGFRLFECQLSSFCEFSIGDNHFWHPLNAVFVINRVPLPSFVSRFPSFESLNHFIDSLFLASIG